MPCFSLIKCFCDTPKEKSKCIFWQEPEAVALDEPKLSEVDV